jgi:adenylosuccinate synthase
VSTAHIVVGLGFGDEGKGTVTDWLVRKHNAVGVVRWNGGPQASHHVVLPDGRWHGFSQFGAGTFMLSVRTHLAKGMLVEPWNLLSESLALEGNGVDGALRRITIDPRCVIVGPWHKLLGQMREAARGKSRHGSVGMGVGAAIEMARRRGSDALVVGDIFGPREALASKVRRDVEDVLGSEIVTQVSVRGPSMDPTSIAAALQVLEDFRSRGRLDPDDLARSLWNLRRGLVAEKDEDVIPELLGRGDVVFEGAQGLMLDPVLGFPPYVTKTRMTPDAALDLIPPPHKTRVIGVLRAFGHRHGPGPFPTEALAGMARSQEHNVENRWQGKFRTGAFDDVLARYAAAACDVDAVAITCLDRLVARPQVAMAWGWTRAGAPPAWLNDSATWDETRAGFLVMGLKKPPAPAYMDEWTRFASECVSAMVMTCSGSESVLESIKSSLKVPVAVTSWGPTWKDKREA